jgi:putative transposase
LSITGKLESLPYSLAGQAFQLVREAKNMNTLEYQLTYRRHLPHIQPPGATLFVTYRLVDSMPKTVQEELLAEILATRRRLDQIEDAAKRATIAYEEQRRMFGRWDAVLDKATSGPRWLSEPAVAQVVRGSLHHLDGDVYDLDTYCIMSNHSHVVFTPLAKDDETYHALPAIMQSLKGFTARKANDILGRKGQFWQHESYDHVVRDEAELLRIRRYVLENPVKAGLVAHWQEWPWSYCKAFK